MQHHVSKELKTQKKEGYSPDDRKYPSRYLITHTILFHASILHLKAVVAHGLHPVFSGRGEQLLH